MKDIDNLLKHLQEHQKFPATREQLLKECDNLSDFSMEDKNWFKETLPEGTYNSSDEVLRAIGLYEQIQMGL